MGVGSPSRGVSETEPKKAGVPTVLHGLTPRFPDGELSKAMTGICHDDADCDCGRETGSRSQVSALLSSSSMSAPGGRMLEVGSDVNDEMKVPRLASKGRGTRALGGALSWDEVEKLVDA